MTTQEKEKSEREPEACALVEEAVNNPAEEVPAADAEEVEEDVPEESEPLPCEREYNLSNAKEEILECLKDIREESGLDGPQADEVLARVLDLATDASHGVIRPEMVSLLVKGAGYAEAVERARAEGELAGRNALIEERLRQPKSATAGVPALGGTAAGSDDRRPASIFDLARFAR